MIKSMTGYGKGQASSETVSLTVEIRSVNHRYSDVSVKAPRALMSLESEMKKRVTARLARGKIDVFINQEYAAGSSALPTVNRPLAAAYVGLFEQLSADFAVDSGIPLSLLVGQKDVLVVKENELAPEEVASLVITAIEGALDALEGMRLKEGEALCLDMEGRLTEVERLLSRIEERAPQVPLEWQARLKERLSRLQRDFEYDPQRVAQEIALFADRCDISEEIVRFHSHLQQFRNLQSVAEPVGRQMDFLVQELNREANTMGSKSNDAEMTRLVVAIKAELEKIREQVQNVE
ncbi:MAG TPA: YicC/YloC family endoribonuclease [Desulfuromonadales bacterium]|nr:YicC/YloC family endoribonuclease [Desulfuromonadales bacterium]